MTHNNKNKNICWNPDITNDFIIDEINLTISWNSKNATNILIYLIKIIGYPYTLNLNQNGLAHFIEYNMKNNVYYDMPVIWSDIMIYDEYIFDNISSIKQLKPLYCHYKKILNQEDINKISILNMYNIYYDNSKKFICINTNDFLEAHYIIKIILDYLNPNNNIDITLYTQYLKSIKIKYNTPILINELIKKIIS